MSRFFHCYSEFVMTFLAKKVQIVLGYVETLQRVAKSALLRAI